MKRPSEAFLSYVASLHRAVHGLGLFFDASPANVTQPEAIVLLYLRGAREATINDVHRTFLHRRSTLTSVLDRMERKGLLTRSTSATDRRSLTLGLTAAGRKAADRVAEAMADLEGRLRVPRRQIASASEVLEQTAALAGELVD